jgi:DNA-binding transcriptional LysR family regulator
MIGAEVLPAGLASFREKHPRIAIELVLSNRTQDLLRREADIAVRMVKPTQAALISRKLGILHLGLHAHPRYLRDHGTPVALAQLATHPLIGFDKLQTYSRLPGTDMPLNRELFSLRCDSDLAQYAAIRAGYGIGACQNALGRRDKLIPVLPGVVQFELGMWLVMHKDLKSNRRVRLMFDYLAEYLRAYARSEGL